MAAIGPYPSWRGLYRAGSVSVILFVVLNIIAFVLDFTAPPPVSGGAATLAFIAQNRTVDVLEQALWLVPGVCGARVRGPGVSRCESEGQSDAEEDGTGR